MVMQEVQLSSQLLTPQACITCLEPGYHLSPMSSQYPTTGLCEPGHSSLICSSEDHTFEGDVLRVLLSGL